MEEERWECISGVCETPGAEGIPVYGVRVCRGDGSVWEWPDVDNDRAVVCRLAERLQSAQPEACHYAEMVTDYIQEIAGAVL